MIVPTFALERAQEILYFLHQASKSSKVPTSAQVFLDPAMAISATEIFRRIPDASSPQSRRYSDAAATASTCLPST